MDLKTILLVIQDATGHKWLPLAVVLVGWAASLTSDWSKFPITVPSRWQPVVVVVLGQAYAVLSAVAGGTPWKQAVLDGAIVSFVTMGLFDLVVKAIFGNKVPKWLAWISFGNMSHPKIANDAVPKDPPAAAA